jgi:hypothetical protein
MGDGIGHGCLRAGKGDLLVLLGVGVPLGVGVKREEGKVKGEE